MILDQTTPSKLFAGDGTTKTFNLPFVFVDAADLQVMTRVTATGVETAQVLNLDFTVSGGGGAVGSVTMATAPASGVQLLVRRRAPITQSLDMDGTPPEPAALETLLDRLVLLLQEARLVGDRSLRFKASDGESLSAELPSATARASAYLAFDSSGNPVAIAKEIASALASSFGASLIDDADASAALTTLGLSAFFKTLVGSADAASMMDLLKVPMRAFLAHKNGTNQTAVADGVWTKATFGTEALDTHACYDTATSRFTPGVAGWSLLFARVAWVNMEDQALMGASIYKNGGTPAASGVDQRAASGTSGFQGCIALAIIDHDADDYFEGWGLWDGTSGTRDIHGATTQSYFGGITFRKN